MAHNPLNDLPKADNRFGWRPPETAPKDGRAFLITTAGPNVDICSWTGSQFQDYFFKQKIEPEWPYMIGWRPLPHPAPIGDTEKATREMNGWGDQ
ncbi:MAG: hypothetical protein KGO96_10455 [Elusimicrobia bacterium]|nr:hypothetical protein [Patescibacteria group bacterium]MDE2426313.1 hypothetical protein [Elusimicrobiota bacterium]